MRQLENFRDTFSKKYRDDAVQVLSEEFKDLFERYPQVDQIFIANPDSYNDEYYSFDHSTSNRDNWSWYEVNGKQEADFYGGRYNEEVVDELKDEKELFDDIGKELESLINSKTERVLEDVFGYWQQIDVLREGQGVRVHVTFGG
jgi:hypothetical protein